MKRYFNHCILFLLTAPLLTLVSCGETAEKPLTCHIEISCASILDHPGLLDPDKNELVPADGLLAAGECAFAEGDSVFDALSAFTREKKLHLEFAKTPVSGSAYIEGLCNLYEFDAGPLSGWMYSVNGVFPNYSCSSYTLSAGDTVVWLYSCELGAEIGAAGISQVSEP